jgi:hypothetical protein
LPTRGIEGIRHDVDDGVVKPADRNALISGSGRKTGGPEKILTV